MAQKSKASPKGIAVYPRLNSPDTKFKEEGEYKTGLRVPAAEAAALVEEIDAAIKASGEQAKKDNPGKKIKKSEFVPYEVDADTGDVTFKFKARASGTRKKDNSKWSFKPPLFNRYGKPMVDAPIVGGGSELKVAYEIRPFWTAMLGAGVSLNIKAVQVFELVQYQGGNADSFGFDSEESEGGEEKDPFGDGDEKGTDEDGGDDDF